ncbi:Oxidoreductase [Psilocybe cubensis]|uniref:Oxidoreductase n=2 Tax=Psilocybe cubensis TaxID=181762 RepID=A0ACB8GKZ5_PSICU|nr:Oxidoreductase [Psilocybe cubensis]KAH9476303.1 Oxidoreductase [Psilocybe cubensis]
MPSLAAIRASNAAFAHSSTYTPVAVFVGGTSGIGEGMVRTFAENTGGKSNIVIVGRNRGAADRILDSLPKPSSDGDKKFTREFVQCDATLMKNVQNATQEILSRHPKINYLIMSPGFATLSGRDETPEGIDKKLAVHYYARWKFTYDLLPALTKAKDSDEKVAAMSVLGAGNGGTILEDDLHLKKNYSISNAAAAAQAYSDMMIESFSERAPGLTFIHSSPGFVRTAIGASSPSTALRWSMKVLGPLTRPFSVSADECSQYMWHAIYSTANKPGPWRIGPSGEDLEKKNYVGSDKQRKLVWDHTEEVINSALAM